MNQDQENSPIQVLIADDHAIVRDGISSLLATIADMEVVGEAANGLQAVANVQTPAARYRPDGSGHAGDGWHPGHRGNHGLRSRCPHPRFDQLCHR